MTVGALMDALSEYPPDLEIGLMVNHSSWYSPCHWVSHGPFRHDLVRLRYAGGATQDIVLLGHDLLFPGKNGYLPEVIEAQKKSGDPAQC
jgi:hypothetical protein